MIRCEKDYPNPELKMKRISVAIAAIFLVSMSSPDAQVSTTGQKTDSKPSQDSSCVLSQSEVDKLLIKPTCLKSSTSNDEWDLVEDFPVSSKGITLSATLYLRPFFNRHLNHP